MALVGLRNPQQYDTPNGARLFDLVYLKMVSSCLAVYSSHHLKYIPIANPFHALQSSLVAPQQVKPPWITRKLGGFDPFECSGSVRSHNLSHKICIRNGSHLDAVEKLQVYAAQKPNQKYVEVQLLARKARALDMKFQAWEDTFPNLWRFQSLENTPNNKQTLI